MFSGGQAACPCPAQRNAEASSQTQAAYFPVCVQMRGMRAAMRGNARLIGHSHAAAPLASCAPGRALITRFLERCRRSCRRNRVLPLLRGTHYRLSTLHNLSRRSPCVATRCLNMRRYLRALIEFLVHVIAADVLQRWPEREKCLPTRKDQNHLTPFSAKRPRPRTSRWPWTANCAPWGWRQPLGAQRHCLRDLGGEFKDWWCRD